MIPPVVWTAGLLRASRQTITTTSWAWIAALTGQVLFQPPNVSGWDYAQWLDTVALGRPAAGGQHRARQPARSTARPTRTGSTRTRSQAYDARDRLLGRPPAVRARPATTCSSSGRRIARGQNQDWEQVEFRNLRQNALRNLIPMTPDWMTA